MPPETSAEDISSAEIDLRPCLVPLYLSELPHDPSTGSNTCLSDTCSGNGETYDLQYTVQQDPVSNRITICAPHAIETALPKSTPFCLTR